jgi:hypothetical protein
LNPARVTSSSELFSVSDDFDAYPDFRADPDHFYLLLDGFHLVPDHYCADLTNFWRIRTRFCNFLLVLFFLFGPTQELIIINFNENQFMSSRLVSYIVLFTNLGG